MGCQLLLVTLLAGATLAFGADTPVLTLGFAAALLAVGGSQLAFDRRRPAIGHLPPDLLLAGAALGAVAILQLAVRAPGAAGPDLMAMAASAGLFLAGWREAQDRKRAHRFMTLILIVLGLMAVAAFLVHLSAPAAPLGQEKAIHAGRLSWPFLSANTAATLFMVTAILSLGGVLRAVARERRSAGRPGDALGRNGLIPMLTLLFALACLGLTASRAGVGIGLCSLAALTLWAGPRTDRRWVMFAGAGILIILAGVVMTSGSGLMRRVDDLAAAPLDRLALWRVCWQAVVEAPLFGHGFGRFPEALAPYITADNAAQLVLQRAAHNLPLQWLVEAGIAGTLVGSVVPVVILRRLWRALRQRAAPSRTVKTLIIVCVAVFAHAMVDFALQIPAVLWWFALLLGIGAGTAEASGGPTERRRRPRA